MIPTIGGGDKDKVENSEQQNVGKNMFLTITDGMTWPPEIGTSCVMLCAKRPKHEFNGEFSATCGACGVVVHADPTRLQGKCMIKRLQISSLCLSCHVRYYSNNIPLDERNEQKA